MTSNLSGSPQSTVMSILSFSEICRFLRAATYFENEGKNSFGKTECWVKECRQTCATKSHLSPLGHQRKPYTSERRRRVLSRCLGWWVGSWMGGDILGPAIFLLFKYFNKQNVLTLNMVSKVSNGFLIQSYRYFKFQNSEI